MRKYNKTKIASVIALSAAVMSFAQSSNENYVQSKTCLNDDCSKRSETITYFDGLGRAKQIVSVKSTPTGKDLVTPVTYDGFGRQIKDILPVPAQTQNSSIHTGIVDESAANTYYGVTNAYSEKQLENSPLDRLLQQASPGEAWKMSSGKTQKFTYDANLGTEVKKFVTTTTTSTANNVYTAVSTLSVASANSGFYPASTLYKNTLTDEDGNPVTEFKNGQGQTLLIRRNDGSQHVDTYYVYNEYNQLAFVLSPKAVKQIELGNNVITDEILNELCYQYKYDGRSRLVEKKIPGKDWEFMVYDRQDRLVLTQDGKLRTTDNNFANRGWLFTKYDELGRVAYTGFYPNTDSRTQVQDQLNMLTASSPNTEIRITNPTTLSGTNLYYRNQAFPSSGITLLTVSYYDTYPSEAPAVPATVLGQPTMSQTLGSSDDASTTGMVTSSYVKNIEDNNWTKAYHYYDSMGRQIAVKTTNHLGGYTNTETELDFAGVAKLSKTYHKRLNGDTEKVITETFEYDNQNRLLVHKHKVDNNPEEILAQNIYNELSQLTNKKVGGTVVSSPLQSIDYTYNIRGWMTKINDPKNLNGKLFGYEIRYNSPVYTSLATGKYNGNIAEVDWAVSQDGILKRYSYQYDRLNRLEKGIYSEPNASIPQNNYFNEELSYDLNGNINILKRNRELQYAGQVMMDDLSYVYNGNQLQTVTDASGNYSGYPDVSGNLIHYDANGNMKDHQDKGLLDIKYNYLNLPNYVKFDEYVMREDPFGVGLETQYKNTAYLYRADGIKLKKVHNYFSGRGQQDASSITEYLDGFQYSGESSAFNMAPFSLQFVPTAEGYYDFVQNKYIYQYKDQIGNVRLAYYKDAAGNVITDRVTDFYPFGLAFGSDTGLNSGGSISPAYRYGYQSQELQSDTGWESFKWRNYDPTMGRFFNVDPLSEKYNTWSHYSFSGNRVVDARELEGLEPHSIHKTYKEASGNFGNQYNNMSIRMNGEIGTKFYKGINSSGTYYSYTTPISAGPNSGAVNSNLAEEPPKGTVQVGVGHTHGEGDETDLGNGQYTTGQDKPSDYGSKMGDISESIKASKENSNFEGDVVITPGGYGFIYGPGTKNGTNVNKMQPDFTNMPKDPNLKKNPNNKNTNKITPEVLPTGETEDNYIQQKRN